jgi:hypothetical protein
MRRFVLLLLALILVGCSEADAVRIGERTFRIEGPPVPGGSEAPNKRLAAELCPGGYRVLDSKSNKGGPDRAMSMPDDLGTTTTWTIRCL